MLVAYGLWMAVSGLGQFIFDYQTLLTGAGALVAAYLAARPVHQQMALMRVQSNGVMREMLLNRGSEIDQAVAAIKDKVDKPLSEMRRNIEWIEDDLIDEHAAHHYDQSLSSAVYWLRVRYRWRDSDQAQQAKTALCKALDSMIDVLSDVHAPAHTDQHGEDYSMSDEKWAEFNQRGEDAKLEVPLALRRTREALDAYLGAIAEDHRRVVERLRTIDAALVRDEA